MNTNILPRIHTRHVGHDGLISLGGTLYQAPPELADQVIEIDVTHFRVFRRSSSGQSAGPTGQSLQPWRPDTVAS